MIVKRGTTDSGARWQLSYGLNGGQHCLEMRVNGALFDDACGFDIPGTTEVGFSGALKPGKGDYILYGVTSQRIVTVRAESAEGNSEVATEKLPEGTQSPLRFFVLTREPVDNVGALVALDASRAVVQRIPLPRR
mgnify:CR=1 FL=1